MRTTVIAQKLATDRNYLLNTIIANNPEAVHNQLIQAGYDVALENEALRRAIDILISQNNREVVIKALNVPINVNLLTRKGLLAIQKLKQNA